MTYAIGFALVIPYIVLSTLASLNRPPEGATLMKSLPARRRAAAYDIAAAWYLIVIGGALLTIARYLEDHSAWDAFWTALWVALLAGAGARLSKAHRARRPMFAKGGPIASPWSPNEARLATDSSLRPPKEDTP